MQQATSYKLRDMHQQYFLFLQKHAMVIDSFSESNQKEASMGKDKDKDKGKDKDKKKKKDKKKDKK